MINHSEMSTHTSGPPPHYRVGGETGRHHQDERHLDGGSVDYTPRPPPQAPNSSVVVRMANASTNTPRSGPPPPPPPPIHVTHGQQQQQPQHRQTSSTFLAHQPQQQQPKKRGPKVGSRRAPVGGPNAGTGQRAAAAAVAVASAGWQHDPLPAPMAKCNSSDGTRQAAGPPLPQHDPYAFHCDSAAPLTQQPPHSQPPSESYQDNGGLDFGPQQPMGGGGGSGGGDPSGDRLRKLHHNHHHHHQDQSRKPEGFINLNELQQTQHQSATDIRVASSSGEHRQQQGRQQQQQQRHHTQQQQQHIDGDNYYNPANNRRFQSNCGRNSSPENDIEQQQAVRVGGGGVGLLTTSGNNLAPHHREKQDQQSVIHEQQEQSGYVRMIAHHHKPQQAGPPQTVSQMQMQSTSPPSSSSSSIQQQQQQQQRTTTTNPTSSNQIQNIQHQNHHYHQQQAPQAAASVLHNHHHQPNPHNHHHNQAANSEQHQQFSGNYNNYYDQQQQQQQELYRSPNSGAPMMSNQQQQQGHNQRFVSRQQYQTVAHHPEPAPPPSHGPYGGPTGFPAGGGGDPAMIMGPEQAPASQVPRVNHQSHHNQHHNHLQQQQQQPPSGGRQAMPQQKRVVGPPSSQQPQLIPVRPNATSHMAPGPAGPNPRLVGDPPAPQHHHQHLQRNQIPKAAQVMNHQPMVGVDGAYPREGPIGGGDMGPMVPMQEQLGGYVQSGGSPTLLQQQLNRRGPPAPGPPPPIPMPNGLQRGPIMQSKQPMVRPSNFGPAQQQPHSELYPPPPVQQPMRPAVSSKRAAQGPQIVRQQVINQQPQQQQQQHLMNVGPPGPPPPAQLDNQHAHLLCNPTPPLTPNAIHHAGPLGQGALPQQQQVHHQRLHQHQEEWQQQHHQHQIGPISEQAPHLPPSHPHHPSQHNGGAGASFSTNGPAPPPPPVPVPNHIGQAPMHRSGGPVGIDGPLSSPTTANSIMPKTTTTTTGSPHTIQYHPTPTAPNLATPSSQQQQQQQFHHHHHHQPGPPGIRPHHNTQDHHHHQHHHHHQQQQPLVSHQAPPPPPPPTSATRLTLPLRDGPLVGPFRLEHGVPYDSRVFHIKGQLMDTLSKSLALANQQQTAAVIQELQFRAYLINGSGNKPPPSQQGESLLAQPNSPAGSAVSRACNWPDLFQVSINQQLVQLDRGGQQGTAKTQPGGATGGAHRAIDVFQYCQPGDNVIEFQVNDCYCNHEFVLELVDRPTLKAFMNSCFKSRTLSQDSCLSKLKYNFGAPGFIPNLQQLPPDVNQLLQSAGIHNEYLTEFVQNVGGGGGEQITRVKISLRCPISARRMTTPARGPHCKHLQCFDLENFLFAHRDRTSWACPVCAQPIPFNMLELDAYQIGVLQEMCNLQATTDDILIDPSGLWQAYYGGSGGGGAGPSQQPVAPLAPPPPQPNQPMYHDHHQQPPPVTAKANGTFHPQAAGSPMPRPMSGHGGAASRGSPAHWDMVHASPQQQQQELGPGNHRISPLRRPPSAISGGGGGGQATPPVPTGRRSASGSGPTSGPAAKRPAYLGASGHPQAQLVVANQAVPASSYFDAPATNSTSGGGGDDDEDLSPLAAMERTIIQHEQQMGPPPFDPNSLTGSSPLRNTSNAQQQQPAQTAPAQQVVGAPAAQSQPKGGHFSPSAAAAASPIQRNLANAPTVPASPLSRQQQQQQQPVQPNSPGQLQQTQVPSTPATPLVHMGPETPATPGSSSMSQQQQTSNAVSQQQQQQQSPHVTSGNNNNNNTSSGQCVEHQPLSNGSASAASITSCSTMTPSSGHSLGSVGMGGDSRCNTAPLQSGLGGSLDDLLGGTTLPSGGSHPGNPGDAYSKLQQAGGAAGHQQSMGGGEGSGASSDLMGAFDEKRDEILMSKLMMDSDPDSMLHRNSELALALEEAQWKQQLDRGKSEHLANFLNDPLMMNGGGGVGGSANSSSSHVNKNNVNHQYHHHHHSQMDGANKMLSGGLNPSDDEGSSPIGDQAHLHHHHSGLDQPLDQFASYLDSTSADDGAGLPPDDSILDLFER